MFFKKYFLDGIVLRERNVYNTPRMFHDSSDSKHIAVLLSKLDWIGEIDEIHFVLNRTSWTFLLYLLNYNIYQQASLQLLAIHENAAYTRQRTYLLGRHRLLDSLW